MIFARARIRASDPIRLLSCIPASRNFRATRGIDIDARNDKWPKEIAFSAFIDTEMRLEHFWRMNLLVAEFRLLENFRLQLELDELLNPLALQQNLRALLVDSDAKFVLLREKERVRLWRKVEAKILKQRTKLSRLIGRKRVSVRIHLSGGRTSNVQRSIVQFRKDFPGSRPNQTYCKSTACSRRISELDDWR